MRWSPVFLYLALVLVLVSAATILISLERESRALAIAGAAGNGVACVLFALHIWLPRRKIDWVRIEAEQRLWESGPLGRRWLSVRRRLSNRWRF